MDQAEVQEEQKTESPCAPQSKVGKDGRVQARLVVLSVKLNANTMNRSYSDYCLVRRALSPSTANANVVITDCSVLRLHNPSKQKKIPLFLNALSFLPKGSGKKSRENGELISCRCESQVPNRPYYLILR